MKTIPFHELPDEGKDFLVDGLKIELSNNRKVTVSGYKNHKGFHIRINKQIDEETQSELKFSLTVDAASALAHLLFMKLDKDDVQP